VSETNPPIDAIEVPAPDAAGDVDAANVAASDAVAAMPPGVLLKAAREAQGLSILDVADVLRFSTRQIELLESDNYAELPGATVVRGFVRGYAKLLKLDSAPLLAALTPEVPPSAPEVRPPSNMGEAEQETRLSAALPWPTVAAGAVILLAIGLVVFFIQSAPNLMSSAEPVSAAVKPADNPVSAGVAAPAAVTVATPAPAPGEALMPPAVALQFEFDDRSWVEIRDATQKVVFVGEYPKGTKQVVEGQAPFQLWIGKAAAVRVTFGDRVIDLKPYTVQDVARLTVE
jgi:cytoskeleton protein RodZ